MISSLFSILLQYKWQTAWAVTPVLRFPTGLFPVCVTYALCDRLLPLELKLLCANIGTKNPPRALLEQTETCKRYCGMKSSSIGSYEIFLQTPERREGAQHLHRNAFAYRWAKYRRSLRDEFKDYAHHSDYIGLHKELFKST